MAEEKQIDQQELMMKFAMFEQEIKQLQEQQQAVEQGMQEIMAVNFGLDDLVGKKGKEILAPIGRGIYAKAELKSEDLLVDIGEKKFVSKSIPDAKKLIESQIKKLQDVKKQLDETLEEKSQEVQKMIEGVQGSA